MFLGAISPLALGSEVRLWGPLRGGGTLNSSKMKTNLSSNEKPAFRIFKLQIGFTVIWKQLQVEVDMPLDQVNLCEEYQPQSCPGFQENI